jgi:hypothetical protein
VPIAPTTYPTEADARNTLLRCLGRFESQDFYAGVRDRISLADPLTRCRIEVA